MSAILIILGLVGMFTACDEPREVSMAQIDQYQDSILALYPTVSVQVLVEERVKVKLIAGGTSLYNAPEDVKQQLAVKAGGLALRILSPDIRKGVMVVTKEIRNHASDPMDGIETDMKIDSLRDALGNK